MENTKLNFAVIGNPISHSLSPEIHHLFANSLDIDLVYDKICVESFEFEKVVKDFFQAKNTGLNVTSPFKELAYKISDFHTKQVEMAGAANVLWENDNKIYADNTDGIGFIQDLTRYIDIKDKSILIIGAGGAARGILLSLLESHAKSITIFARRKEQAIQVRCDFQNRVLVCDDFNTSYDIIINATSGSAFHQNSLIPDDLLMRAEFCYDLAYDLKKPTKFVCLANQLGVRAKDGLGMLISQAAFSFKIWHEIMPDTQNICYNEGELKYRGRPGFDVGCET